MPAEVQAAPAAAPTQPAAPAPAAPNPAPAAPKTEAAGGIDKAMAEFNEQTTPKKPEAKPVAKGKEKPADKPGEKPGAKPGEKPGEEAVDWEKADPKLKGAHFKHQREAQTKIEALEKQVKDIQGKAKEAPGDRKLIEEYQGRIDRLEKDLATASYERSAEFKTQFVEKWSGEYKAAVQEISQLQITVPGAAEGQPPQKRPATEADFQKILRLPPGDQDEAISTLFGPFSNRVFTRLFELQRIERASQEAVSNHAKTIETRTKENELRMQKESEDYERHHGASMQELQQKWPQHFAPDDKDAEVTEALQKGYDFVDTVLKKSDTMPLEERAAYSAVLRARAAAFPRVVLEKNRLASEVESLKEELKKYRASDPGSGGDGGGGEAPNPGEVNGIEAMAARVMA